MRISALTKQNATLAFAVVGALTGLASLSMNVWERIEYRPRVQMQRASLFEIQRFHRRPEFQAHVAYENLGKYRMNVSSAPLLTVHHPDGRQFGPYLMMPMYPYPEASGFLVLEPLEAGHRKRPTFRSSNTIHGIHVRGDVPCKRSTNGPNKRGKATFIGRDLSSDRERLVPVSGGHFRPPALSARVTSSVERLLELHALSRAVLLRPSPMRTRTAMAACGRGSVDGLRILGPGAGSGW
jgi:hypothetical protein